MTKQRKHRRKSVKGKEFLAGRKVRWKHWVQMERLTDSFELHKVLRIYVHKYGKENIKVGTNQWGNVDFIYVKDSALK